MRPEHVRRAKILLQNEVDWPALIQTALYHSLLPVVGRHLENEKWIELPAGFRDEVRERLRGQAFKSQFLINELCRVMGHLQERSIPVISIKGPTLSKLAYGDAALRWYTDLDLIISAESSNTIAAVLHELGYEMHPAHSRLSAWTKMWKAIIGAQFMYSRGHIFHLDVHTHVMPLHFANRFPAEILLNRAVDVHVGACSLPCPEPELLLQVMCFHGQKNRWETLKYICDVNEIIESSPEMRWDEVIEESRRHGGLGVLLLGVLLAREVLSASLPADVERQIERYPALRDVSAGIRAGLPDRQKLGTLGLRDRIKLHYSVQDTFSGKVRYTGTALLQRIMTGKNG